MPGRSESRPDPVTLDPASSLFPRVVSCCTGVRTRGQAWHQDLKTVVKHYSVSSQRPREHARTSGQDRMGLRTVCGSKQWGKTLLLGKRRETA